MTTLLDECAESCIWFVTAEEAELGKMLHNGLNAAKISYFNQAGRLASAVAAATGKDVSMSRIQEFLPVSCEGLRNPAYGTISGAPYGGHCLPKDAQALASLESALLTNANSQRGPQFFEAVVEVNRCMSNIGEAPAQSSEQRLQPQEIPVQSGAASGGSTRVKRDGLSLNALEICAGLHLLDTSPNQQVLAECNMSHPPLQPQ